MKELYEVFYGMLKAHALNGNQLPDIPFFTDIQDYPKSLQEYSMWYKRFMRLLDNYIQEHHESHNLESYLERLVLLPHYSFDEYIEIFENYGFRLNKSTPEQLRFIKYYPERLLATVIFEPYNRKLSVITNGNSIEDYQQLIKDLDSLHSQYHIIERTFKDDFSSSK